MENGSNNNDGVGGCPVDHKTGTATSSNTSQPSWNPVAWFSKNVDPPEERKVMTSTAEVGGCPVKHDGNVAIDGVGDSGDGGAGGGCPVDHKAMTKSQGGNTGKSPFALPPSLEEHAKHAQRPHPEQRVPLSTHRVTSSIPRADKLRQEPNAPHHQRQEDEKWVYPSEQQFYNAVRRKGWDGVDESNIPLVVLIHNSVNEKAWRHVRKWEKDLHGCDDPRLVRFLGRPKDMSFKAMINTYLFAYNPPFDRHDWFVDRGDGKEPRRYIIDFYNGNDGSDSRSLLSTILQRVQGKNPTPNDNKNNNNANDTDNKDVDNGLMVARKPAMYLDVRPAGDSPEAFVDRCQMFVREMFPGIFSSLQGSNIGNRPVSARSVQASAIPTQNKQQNQNHQQ